MAEERIVVRSSTDDHILFKVFQARYPQTAGGERPYNEHHHSELEISSILSGSGVYHCSGVDYAFEQGDVFMHCGNDKHHFRQIDPGRALSLVVIQFDPRFIWTPGGDWFDSKYLRIFMSDSATNRHISRGDLAAARISALLQESFQECSAQDPAYDLLVKAKLLAILANLARHFHDELEGEKFFINPRHLEYIKRSMDYILSHLGDPLTLDTLAQEARMSRSYYCTIFKRLNGVSVWSYITAQRIDKAQRLLEDLSVSVTEVSQACGFNNIANFNRAFKKVAGLAPRDYRRAVQPDRPPEEP